MKRECIISSPKPPNIVPYPESLNLIHSLTLNVFKYHFNIILLYYSSELPMRKFPPQEHSANFCAFNSKNIKVRGASSK